ncbi:MAG: alpha-L-fucosidase [Candidatus Sumerlaeota bacterium]|nr:alpha-L-fucosidase [Candidatus Sumerlaeota bacterium]
MLKKMSGIILLALLAAASANFARAAEETKYEPTWESLDKRPAPPWFLDAKFGIFIHWGVYSVPAWGPVGEYAEWYWNRVGNTPADKRTEKDEKNKWWVYHREKYGKDFTYDKFAPMFKAEKFNANEWAKLFADAGAKYIVPTSKHHDGFCLWPSKEASATWGRPWNAVETGPKRDLMDELSKAVRQQGIKFGFYYSYYEWFNPLWLTDKPAYVEKHMIPQFKDVVTRYKPALLFLDGEWDMPPDNWKSRDLLAWLYNEAPGREDLIVNDRLGKGARHKHGGYYTTEYGAGLPNADHPWEESRGMAFSYGYNRAETEKDYKTVREFVLMLADTVSRGGNLLLDIGPDADGTIPKPMQDRLRGIGRWLQTNGEAIYGTRTFARTCQWSAGAAPEQKYGEFKVKYDLMNSIGFEPRDGKAVKSAFLTTKGNVIYAILPSWPPKGQLKLTGLASAPGAGVSLLGSDAAAKYAAQGDDIAITLPEKAPEGLTDVDVYTLKLTGFSAAAKK